ncbi:hypothetical protein Ahy_B09g096732 [Arachis hypogaea]|uniref:Uncharacterized protein n=1 Tax=Arachis hypogaea TaxID=3818 RepID=A0A444XM13_ARAHY|nr:hypothetical protein Ahy_B09g096732 [Arachis hypogaea]
MFHFDEDCGGIIKRIILKMLGRAWKETRNRLYDHCYDSEQIVEENIERRPPEITADDWRWYLDYHNSKETKVIYFYFITEKVYLCYIELVRTSV